VTATVSRFHALLSQMGSPVTYHREAIGSACPCRTPEGFRDPRWHKENPMRPVCNEQGYLAAPAIQFQVQASVQPISVARSRFAERADVLLGELQEDDHIGIFPVQWGGNTLDFSDWSSAGEDYIIYDNRRFMVVGADKLPDIDGDPNHHFEVGLRLIKMERPS
jgi:hypothetical protein